LPTSKDSKLKKGKHNEIKHIIYSLLKLHQFHQKINVGLYKMKVDLYIPNPTRCFQCQKFGHGKQSCRSHAKCYRCSDDDHDGLICDKPIKCTNCNLDDMSSSKECPVYLTEKQIKKITVEKISVILMLGDKSPSRMIPNQLQKRHICRCCQVAIYIG